MRRHIFLTFACSLFSLGLLAVGLWPFNFLAENHANLATHVGGLKFKAPAERSQQNLGGMVFTPNPLACRMQSDCKAGALTIKLELTAENELSPCLKRIMEVLRPNGSKAFYIGQWKSSLIVRSFNIPLAKGKPYQEIGAGEILTQGRNSSVVIISGPQGTDISFDGKPLKKYPGVRLLHQNETLEGHKLYLGNSSDLSCPWSGSILGIAIHGKDWTSGEMTEEWQTASGNLALCGDWPAAVACYRFDGLTGETIADLSGSANNLRIPIHLVFDKQSLGLPDSQSISTSDVALNLIGFVPFGFLVCLRLLTTGRLLPPSCLLFAIGAGFAASLFIEVTQVWLPGRDSSLLDLTANTMGSTIGAAMAIHLWRAYGTKKYYSH